MLKIQDLPGNDGLVVTTVKYNQTNLFVAELRAISRIISAVGEGFDRILHTKENDLLNLIWVDPCLNIANHVCSKLFK